MVLMLVINLVYYSPIFCRQTASFVKTFQNEFVINLNRMLIGDTSNIPGIKINVYCFILDFSCSTFQLNVFVQFHHFYFFSIFFINFLNNSFLYFLISLTFIDKDVIRNITEIFF